MTDKPNTQPIVNLVELAQSLVDDPEIKRLKLDKFVATILMLHTERAINELAIAARISELEHRVLFLASCLMAGDTLVPSGRLVMASSLELLERWISDDARAQAAKRAAELERSSSAARRRN